MNSFDYRNQPNNPRNTGYSSPGYTQAPPNPMADENLMDWNDTIEDDGRDFVILEDGDYNFMVAHFDRARHPGSAKLPACNKASLTLQVATEHGIANVFLDLFLYRTMEWKLSQFFRCIGQKQKDERLIMDWDHIVGALGRARFKRVEYTGNDGSAKVRNEVERFYDYDPKYFENTVPGFLELPDRVDEPAF